MALAAGSKILVSDVKNTIGSWWLTADMASVNLFRQLTAATGGLVDAGLATNSGGTLTVTAAGTYVLSAAVVWGLQTNPACRLQTILTLNAASISGSGVLSGGEVLPGGSSLAAPSTAAGVGSSLVQSISSAPFVAAAGDTLRVYLFSDLAVAVRAGSATSHEGRTSIHLRRLSR